MNRLPILRLAAIGLVTALALAGCGRKGPLDPPPGAWVTQPGETPHQGANQPAAAPASQPAYDAEGRPLAPAGPNRRIPADALLN